MIMPIPRYSIHTEIQNKIKSLFCPIVFFIEWTQWEQSVRWLAYNIDTDTARVVLGDSISRKRVLKNKWWFICADVRVRAVLSSELDWSQTEAQLDRRVSVMDGRSRREGVATGHFLREREKWKNPRDHTQKQTHQDLPRWQGHD